MMSSKYGGLQTTVRVEEKSNPSNLDCTQIEIFPSYLIPKSMQFLMQNEHFPILHIFCRTFSVMQPYSLKVLDEALLCFLIGQNGMKWVQTGQN